MRYLVDANVLSEATKPTPDPLVLSWLERCEGDLAVDPIILAELRFGILLLAQSQRRTSLERWFVEGVARLRCIDWDASTGLRWATLLADLRAAGRTMPIKDSMIAATALNHDLAIATLNLRDFQGASVRLVDPTRGA